MSAAMARAFLLWSVAAALGGLGTGFLFDAAPGLNWGIWTLAAAGGLLLCARVGGSPMHAALLVPLALAAGFGVAAAVTAAPPFHAVIAGGVAVLLAIAVLLAGNPGWEGLTAPFMLRVPVAAPLLVAGEAIRRAFELVGLVATPRHRPLLRGVLFALPVVGLFTLILTNADPVLATLRDDLAAALARLDFVPRVMFFGGLFTVALGGCGSVLHRGSARGPAPVEPARIPRLADTERLVILGAVGALFSAFLLLQLSYLFGNAPVIPGSGVTFSEYARRGFAELTTVATLCTILLAALDHWAARGPREAWTRLAAVAVVGQGEVLLISALRRLWLYESAYGFTTVRLYAHAYMVVVALFLGMLGWGLARGLTSGWLARRAAALAAVAMAALIYWNHEAWIVRQNVGRFLRTDQLDTSYLVWGLSPNGAPALVGTIPQLPPALTDSVRDGLRQRYGRATRGAPCRWFEWNRGRERAVAALRASGIVRGDAQLHPHDCVLIGTATGSLGQSPLGRDRRAHGRALRLHVPAARARAQRQAGVEVLDGRVQLPLDVGHVHRHPVEKPIAVVAEPAERLGLLGPSLDLDHQAPRIGRARRIAPRSDPLPQVEGDETAHAVTSAGRSPGTRGS